MTPRGVEAKYTELPRVVAVLSMNFAFNLHLVSDIVVLFKYSAPPYTALLYSKITFTSVFVLIITCTL